MWQDMKTYWAWRGEKFQNSCPPSKKEIKYASIIYKNNCMKLAVFVRENGKLHGINFQELMWHINHGAKIIGDKDMNIWQYIKMLYSIKRARYGRVCSAWLAFREAIKPTPF